MDSYYDYEAILWSIYGRVYFFQFGLTSVGCMWNNGSRVITNHPMQVVSAAFLAPMPAYTVILAPPLIMIVTNH